MTDDLLIDTNVLVYSYDAQAPEKRGRATELLDRLAGTGRGRLSAQILGEFFRVVTSRLRPPVPPEEAFTQVTALAGAWSILPITPFVVIEAARGVRDHRLNYWDSQIWATARLHQVRVVLSEDFQEGRELEGVIFRNPFVPAFDVAALG